jgi:predicted 2-oxoglutarate/Fe(II)-dependent dioxygenase YbiX
MKQNLSDYLIRFESVIPADICEQVIVHIQQNDWKQHTFSDPITNTAHNRSGNQELDISYSVGEIENQVASHMRDAFIQYLGVLALPWFAQLQAATHPRFNKYLLNRKMAMHADHIHTIFDGNDRGIPVLTALAILNDKYEGGELVFWQDTVVKTGTGDIFVWPSLFLYPHRVEPVTKGERYSAVSWAW